MAKRWGIIIAALCLSVITSKAGTPEYFKADSVSVSRGALMAFGGEMVAGIPEILLKAICLGAVFFGSMTYIGNGPNFMVKAIAEENGVQMPSFVGYIFKFSLIVLLPVYILVQLIFL